MKVIVAVIVYDRIENLRRWLECWKQCDTEGAELVIIHNDNGESEKFKALCDEAGVKYIGRYNIGLDIGAFQDVCRFRLNGFPKDWDYLLWCTDDTYPMTKDFVWQFYDAMQENVGLACMKISGEVSKHVRTTGFFIYHAVARKLQFPADPVTTKAQCYLFEHKAGNDTMTNQIRRMGFDIVQVAPTPTSPLWDSEHRKRLDRIDEHDKLFGFYKEKTVTFICPIYKSYPVIISSLLMQTNPNWKLWLIHDGPTEDDFLQCFLQWLSDDRIKVIITDQRRGNWGHSYRSEYLQKVETDFVVITNSDNYHMPTFVEYMMKTFKPNTVGTYCSYMVHSYKNWAAQQVRLERGHIDCAGMMLRTKEAKAVGWNDVTSHSADWIFFNDLIKKYGVDRFVKREGCLLVHN